jgi:hypothetical protein
MLNRRAMPHVRAWPGTDLELKEMEFSAILNSRRTCHVKVSKLRLLTCSNQRKAGHLTGRGGLYGCEILEITCCSNNWLVDGGKVINPT